MKDKDSKLLWEAYLREDEQPLLPGFGPPPQDHMKELASRLRSAWIFIKMGEEGYNLEEELYDMFYDIPKKEFNLEKLIQHLQSADDELAKMHGPVPELIGWLNGRPLKWENEDMRIASLGRKIPMSIPPFDIKKAAAAAQPSRGGVGWEDFLDV